MYFFFSSLFLKFISWNAYRSTSISVGRGLYIPITGNTKLHAYLVYTL